jgi:two-component sensor histidine kinase
VALSKTHDLLTTRNWEGVSLRDLILRELEPYPGGQFAIKGEDIHLKPEMALTLGMALHELATNAAKYGALSVPTGRVDIAWEVTNNDAGQRHLHLRWIETGGPPVKERKRWGLGSKLIERALAYSLNGETRLDFAASGVKCTIDAPLSRLR